MKTFIYNIILFFIFNQSLFAQSWSTIPGMNASILTLYTDTIKNVLYAGGNFTTAGGTSVKYIAKWNGTKWDSLGKGVSNTVYAITKYKNEIYVGGPSTIKWSDTTWTPLLDTYQNTFCEYNGNLYAGAGDIVRWNGTKWDYYYNTSLGWNICCVQKRIVFRWDVYCY